MYLRIDLAGTGSVEGMFMVPGGNSSIVDSYVHQSQGAEAWPNTSG